MYLQNKSFKLYNKFYISKTQTKEISPNTKAQHFVTNNKMKYKWVRVAAIKQTKKFCFDIKITIQKTKRWRKDLSK